MENKTQTQTNNNKLLLTIPTNYFHCPISMEVMKSPVSLSTGVTYDRSSIQTWLDSGHSTCPATMLPLSSPFFIPNLTLHRLIHHHPSNSEPNRRVLVNSREFASFVGGELFKIEDVEVLLRILLLFLEDHDDDDVVRQKLQENIVKWLPNLVLVTRKGSMEVKIAMARFLAKMANDEKMKRAMMESEGLLSEAMKLFASESDSGVEAGGWMITAVAVTRAEKSEFVRMGVVRRAGGIIGDERRGRRVVEEAMEVLVMAATCREGRKVICKEEGCLGMVVKRMMKVSERVTEQGVMVVWSVCYRFPDEQGRRVVLRSNGLGKCLLVLQSCCGGGVKEMCRDLVKILSGGNGDVCFGGYDSKTIHIMPY